MQSVHLSYLHCTFHYTALYYTALLHCTLLYSTALDCTIIHLTTLDLAVKSGEAPFRVTTEFSLRREEKAGRGFLAPHPNTAPVQCSAVLCRAVQCSAVQCMQCSAIQCSALAVHCSADPPLCPVGGRDTVLLSSRPHQHTAGWKSACCTLHTAH